MALGTAAAARETVALRVIGQTHPFPRRVVWGPGFLFGIPDAAAGRIEGDVEAIKGGFDSWVDIFGQAGIMGTWGNDGRGS